MTFRIEKSPIILSFVTNQSYQRQQYTHQTKNNQMHLWKSCELKDMHCYSNLAELLLTPQRSERSKTVVMIDTIVSVCLPVCLVWSLWQKTPVCLSVCDAAFSDLEEFLELAHHYRSWFAFIHWNNICWSIIQCSCVIKLYFPFLVGVGRGENRYIHVLYDNIIYFICCYYFTET